MCCNDVQETEEHLFAKCGFSGTVWYVVFKWLGFNSVLSGNLFILLQTFTSFEKLGTRNLHKFSLHVKILVEIIQ